MKTLSITMYLMFCGTCAAGAQQAPMEDVPGMKMSAPGPKAAPKPSPTSGDLKGMGQDTADPAAMRAAKSEEESVKQQAGQRRVKPGASSDASSITLPMQELQEPEAVGFRTGQDLPAPDLLQQIVAREPMTVENFIDAADRSNPTLVQAQRNVDRSNQQARQVGLPPDPTVGYSGDHIRGGSYHGGEEGAFVAQVFVLGRKLALRRNIYLAEGKANQYELEVQRARVHDDVARSFFHALAMQESVVIRDRLLKVALDADTNAHELERVGQADATDVLSAEIAAEQAKVDFEEAQRMFLASFAELSSYAGQSSVLVRPLAGNLVEPPLLDADAMALSNTSDSPYVKSAESKVPLAEARLKDAKRERVPDLSVKAGEWYSGEELGATPRKAGWESFAEVGVQLPLWNRNQGNIEAAKAELSRAEQEVTRTQLWTRHRAEPYAQQYLTARATAQRYQAEMLPRARRAYQLEVTKYQQMGQSYPHVLTAQHMLFTLQLAYVQTLDREWQAAIALQNFSLSNALDAPTDAGEDATSMNLPTGKE